MDALVKAFIGVLLMVGTVAVMVWSMGEPVLPVIGKMPNLVNAFVNVLLGSIPPFVFLIGLFIFWLEIDEWKIERELKAEEEKEKEEKEKKK